MSPQSPTIIHKTKVVGPNVCAHSQTTWKKVQCVFYQGSVTVNLVQVFLVRRERFSDKTLTVEVVGLGVGQGLTLINLTPTWVLTGPDKL